MTKQPDLMGMAVPDGLPRGEQGVKRSSGTDAKASGSALLREGRSPFPFQRLGIVVATIVAALTVTGCGIAERRVAASAEYEEGRRPQGRLAGVPAEVECRPIRRSSVVVGRRGDVRRDLTEIPGVC